MDIFLQFLLLILGFILLIKGADFLVDGSCGIARRFKISEAVIGMTIVAFGTSAPELSVAFTSFIDGTTDLILGDIVGCAISNILLLIGVAAIIRPVKISKESSKKEIPFYLLVIGVFVGLILFASYFIEEKTIGRIGGIILISLFIVFLLNAIKSAKKKNNKPEKREKKEAKKSILLYSIYAVGGIISVIAGSNLVVNSATKIALDFGVTERIIAMTIVAIGTSLPELMTTIVAARKNEQGLLLGNAIGSNIFNITFALGLPTIIFGGLSVANFGIFDLASITLAAVILWTVTRKDKKITRLEGAVMLSTFAIYYATMLIWT